MRKLSKISLCIFTISLLGIVVLSIVFGFYLFNSSYDVFTENIADSIGKSEWLGIIRFQYFTKNTFEQVQTIYKVVLPIILVLVGVFFFKMSSIKIYIEDMFLEFHQSVHSKVQYFKNTEKYEQRIVIFVLIFISIKSLLYILNWPLQYDECWTYNYFISNNILASFCYPGNNHILYTLVAWFFNLLPLDSQLSMRIPVWVAGISSIVLFYIFLKDFLPKKYNLLSWVFFSSSCPVVFYMLYARGYIFMMFFVILLLYSSMKLVSKTKKIYSISYILSITLGLYSLPSFVYPYLMISSTTLVFLLRNRSDFVIKFIILNAIGLVLATILWLPIIVTTKLQFYTMAISNQQRDFSFAHIQVFIKEISHFLMGIEHKGLLYTFSLLILVLAMILHKKLKLRNRSKYLVGICLLMMLSPIMVYLFQGSFLFGRIYSYIIIFIAIGLYFMLSFLPKKVLETPYILTLACLLVLSLNSIIAQKHSYFNWSIPYDTSCKKMSKLMIDNKIDTTYLFPQYYKPGIEYYYKTKGKDITIKMNENMSRDFEPFDINKGYQSVIYEPTDSIKLNNSYSTLYIDSNILLDMHH